MVTAAPPPDNPAAREASIEKRLARIERTMEKVDEVAAQLPLMIATITEIADSSARKIPDIDGRFQSVVGVLERLSRPQTIEALEKLLDAVEQGPQLVSTAVDIADDLMAKAAASGVEIESLVESTGKLLGGLFELATSPEVRNLLDSGMLDRGAVQTLGRAARALTDTKCQDPKPVGMFGALRALGDEDVQRALGFTLSLAGAFGREIQSIPDDANGRRHLNSGT